MRRKPIRRITIPTTVIIVILILRNICIFLSYCKRTFYCCKLPPFPQHSDLLSELDRFFFWRRITTVPVLASPGKLCGIPQKCQVYDSTLPRYVRDLSPPTHAYILLQVNFFKKSVLDIEFCRVLKRHTVLSAARRRWLKRDPKLGHQR